MAVIGWYRYTWWYTIRHYCGYYYIASHETYKANVMRKGSARHTHVYSQGHSVTCFLPASEIISLLWRWGIDSTSPWLAKKDIVCARFYVLNARKSGMSEYEVMVWLKIRGRLHTKQASKDHSIAELNILPPEVQYILIYYKTKKHPTDIT